MANADGLAETAETDGVRVGPYRLIARIGAGGMGEVWRAYDELLRRDIAIKILPAARAGNAESRARMLREARAQAALNHPNICTIYQAGDDDDGVWIAMERLPGPTLAELSKSPPEIGRIARWGHQIARALAAAHAVGLAHRDLKPSNAMLDARGEVKLLDFGLAKRLEDAAADTQQPHESHALTEEGRVIGTPRYMSPEQAAGEPIGVASDVFSLGVMLFELLAGRPPFVANSAVEMMALIIQSDAPSLAEAAPHVPTNLASVVQACLSRKIQARPSAEEVAAKLDAFAAASASAAVPALRPRRRTAWLVIVGAVVAIVAIVVWQLRDRGDAAAPAPPDAAAAKQPPEAPPEEPLASGDISEAAFSFDGRSLVFIADRRAWISRDGGTPSVLPIDVEPLLVSCCVAGKLAISTADDTRTLDPVTNALTPSTLDRHDSPDGKHRVMVELHRVSLASDGAATIPIATAKVGEEFFGTAMWSPDGNRVAWLRTSEHNVRVEVYEAAGAPREVARLGHALPGLSTSLAWRNDGHLVAMQHERRGSALVEIDVLERPTPTPRVLARWPNKTLALRAIHGDRFAVVQWRNVSDLVLGAIDGQRIQWSVLDGLREPSAWARDGRVIAGRLDHRAKTIDLVLASRTDPPVPLVTGHPDSNLTVVATTATDVLYTRRFPNLGQAELWRTDLGGRSRTRIAMIGVGDEIACGATHCAILESAPPRAILRELDPITGAVGKPLFETPINVGQTKNIGASPDGERFAVPVESDVVIVERRTGKQRIVAVENSVSVHGVDLTADPTILYVADSHLPDGFSVSRVTGSRTEVLSTDGFYSGLTLGGDDKQLAAIRRRETGDIWIETVRPAIEWPRRLE
ncbi:MAG: protein kinase domain-containing protein [Kofleriaceae bacterium]